MFSIVESAKSGPAHINFEHHLHVVNMLGREDLSCMAITDMPLSGFHELCNTNSVLLDISRDCGCQVETAGQMAYLHHRLSQCPHENELLAKARQLGRQTGRPAAHTAPHKVMPLQVCLSLCPHSLMPSHCCRYPSSTARPAPSCPPSPT